MSDEVRYVQIGDQFYFDDGTIATATGMIGGEVSLLITLPGAAFTMEVTELASPDHIVTSTGTVPPQ